MTIAADALASDRADAPIRARLGDYLVRNNKLSSSALERAERLAAESGENLELVLGRLGLISDQEIALALSKLLGLPIAAGHQYPQTPVMPDRFSQKFLREARLIPLRDEGDRLMVAMVDPLNDYAAEASSFAAGKKIVRAIAYPSDFEAAYERLYGGGTSEIHQLSSGAQVHRDDTVSEDVERIKDGDSEAPVVRLVNLLITQAVEAGASDIHLEPMEGELRVRFRIDGVLQNGESPPQRLSAAITSRIKIMAKLNIAERRMAQDGRIKLAVRGKDIDFRVSTMPTIHGESVVLRILDRSDLKLDFAALGFDAGTITKLHEILDRPHGILLATGPTGSGKTTTLYAGLQHLNTADKKILTVEDPVEYQIGGINQVQVKPQIGLTFATALRSFLRQDPDIMMVGEIRDLETAQVAVQAALTGHLILSTLHTNDAASAITRLLDMGMESFLLTTTINGLLAQRLVRNLCPQCREPYAPAPDFLNRMGLEATQPLQVPERLYRHVGCAHCNGTGYKGRSSIVELLTMSDTIRQLILQRAEALAIRRQAIAEGMQTMQAQGVQKAMRGETSIEEVFRVTRLN